MKSDYFGCTIAEVIAPPVSTWKEAQPTSANCVVIVLVVMTNCINSPALMGKKMKYKYRLDAKVWLYLIKWGLV